MSKKILKNIVCCLVLSWSGLSAYSIERFAKCIAKQTNLFSHNLYQQFNLQADLIRSTPENILFSPYSISTALAMTFAGAKDQTREEMMQAVGLSMERCLFFGSKRIAQILSKKTSINVANKIFAHQDYSIEQDFTDKLTEYFNAPIEQVNFATQGAIDTINGWVSGQTREKIKTIVSSRDVDSNTRMVLANAVYFKSDWLKKFKAHDTRVEAFYKSEDDPMPVDMMQQTSTFKYVENEDLQLIELPYDKDDMSMFIALPREGKLANVEKTLNTDNFEKLMSEMNMHTVNVKLPKFKFETSYSLRDTLSNMGMPTAFGPSADFSGITGSKDLYISDVLHKAVIEVDEQGSEAAAATAVVMNMKATFHTRLPLTIMFEANRPFLFFIRDNETGLFLFTGRVCEPAEMSTSPEQNSSR